MSIDGHADKLEPAPMVGEPPHLDIEETLRQLYRVVHEIKTTQSGEHPPLPEAKKSYDIGPQTALEAQLIRRQKILQVIGWFLGIGVGVFSAGVAYQTFIGANAMDDEVDRAIDQHNTKHIPDAHPQISEELNAHKEKIEQIETITKSIEKKQDKIEKLTEYNYEAQKWQVDRLQCSIERCGKKKEKPAKLEKLEEDLRYGRY